MTVSGSNHYFSVVTLLNQQNGTHQICFTGVLLMRAKLFFPENLQKEIKLLSLLIQSPQKILSSLELSFTA
jgi:hypothetical protein